MKKSERTIWTEGALYVTIAVGSQFAEFLISDRPITARALTAVTVMAIVAGANALKAFLSQSMSDGKDAAPTGTPADPLSAVITNTPEQRVPVEEKPKP